MATIQLTKDNFEDIVSKNDYVLIDFWATWCAPCRMFGPIFEAASEQYPDMVFAKVNTEEEQELAAYFQIRSIPTLMIFREQIGLFSQPGALPEPALLDLIKQVRELDMDDVRSKIAEQKAAEGDAAEA